MTIRLLTDWPYRRASNDGEVTIPAGNIVAVFDAATEAGMIAAKVAASSSEAVTWTPPSEAKDYADDLTLEQNQAVRTLVLGAGNIALMSGRSVTARPFRDLQTPQPKAHSTLGLVMCDLTGATFSGTNGSGAYDSGPSSYGNLTPVLLTINAGSTGNDARAVWTSGTRWANSFNDDGGVITIVAEIVSGFDSGNTVKLVFSSDSAATKTATATLTINKQRDNLLFWNVYPDSSDFAFGGGETFSNTMNYLAVEATSAGGTTGGVIKIHGIWKYQRRRASVQFVWDDGWVSQYTNAFQYLARKGLVADMAVSVDYVGGNYMSVAMMDEMYRAGWDLTIHGSKNHNDVSLTTGALLRAEIKKNQDWVLANGWTRGAYEYVYPGGIINSATDSKAQLRSLGFRTARIVSGAGVHLVYPTPWGIGDPMCLAARDLSGSYSSASNITLLDRAIANNSHVIFYGHRIVRASPAANEITWAEFKATVDAVSSRVSDGAIDVLTQAQFADRYIGPVAT